MSPMRQARNTGQGHRPVKPRSLQGVLDARSQCFLTIYEGLTSTFKFGVHLLFVKVQTTMEVGRDGVRVDSQTLEVQAQTTLVHVVERTVGVGGGPHRLEAAQVDHLVDPEDFLASAGRVAITTNDAVPLTDDLEVHIVSDLTQRVGALRGPDHVVRRHGRDVAIHGRQIHEDHANRLGNLNDVGRGDGATNEEVLHENPTPEAGDAARSLRNLVEHNGASSGGDVAGRRHSDSSIASAVVGHTVGRGVERVVFGGATKNHRRTHWHGATTHGLSGPLHSQTILSGRTLTRESSKLGRTHALASAQKSLAR
ncbi:capsid [uncultured virus]|uniref:Capsid n=1 Tax=uncultured virus TaxID=340016 RepID=A0A2K9LSG0_9VIRU|nr:capsid [uncultured virus]